MTKVGVLLTNLGTPDAPTVSAVKRYLAEFLWDPYVIDKPRWLWWLVLHGIILRIRPKKSAAAYRKIWDDKTGSPLLHYSQQQAEKLQKALPEHYTVALGMRYGKPSIRAALESLKGCEKIVVIPLYPQYSLSTTKSTLVEIEKRRREFGIENLEFVWHYHDHPLYIEALADSVKRYWQQHSKPQLLLMSFHGLPLRYVESKGDPYQQQCYKTAELLAAKLKLTKTEYQVTFQSRVGTEPWLQPYTDKTLEALPQKGITDIQVICPGFAADCLETLEEIDLQNRTLFLQRGGKTFHYIPALNDSDKFIAFLKKAF